MSNSIVYGKILGLDVRAGSARQIFGYGFQWPPRKVGSNKVTLKWMLHLDSNIISNAQGEEQGENKLKDALGIGGEKNEELETSLEEIPEANCVSLKMIKRVENTRLIKIDDWWRASPLLNPVNTKVVYTVHKGPDKNLDFIAENFKKKNPTLTPSTHVFMAYDELNLNLLGPNFIASASFGTTATYREVAPERNNTVIRILQDNVAPWVTGQLVLNDTLPSNPSLYIELEPKEPPAQQSTDDEQFKIKVKEFKRIVGGVSVTTNEREVLLKSRMFGIKLGLGTKQQITFVFQDGMVPYAIRDYDKSVCIHRKGKESCNFSVGGPITLEVRWVPPGIYKITTNILPSPFLVYFGKEVDLTKYKPGAGGEFENKAKFITMDPAHMAYFFIGMGVHTFAFSPARFPLRADAVAEIPKSYPVTSISSNAKVRDLTYIPISKNGLYSCRILPAIVAKPIQDPNYGASYAFYLWYNITVTEDDRQTPFLYYFEFEPQESDYEIQPTEDPPQIEGIKSITLQPSIESLYKLKMTGSITLTNFNGEWDNAPQAKPIRIKFKWVDHNDEEGSLEDTEGYSTVFTGYMVKPRLDRKGVQEKYVTFELRDRWYMLDSNKIENSPFYDGTLLYDTLVDLLTSAGIAKDDILFYPKAEKFAKSYTLAQAPGFYFNPKFRFAFGTSYAKAIDEVMKTTRLFYYFASNGKFVVASPEDIIKPDSEAKIFYASLEDIPQDADEQAKYRILSAYQYTKDTDSMYNWFLVRGYDYTGNNESEAAGSLTKTFGAVSINIKSLIDPSYPYYLGFPAPFYMAKTWLASQEQVNYMANELKVRFSRPREEVTWTLPYYVGLPLYSPVKFKDTNGSIPGDKVFHITSVTINYDSSTLKATSVVKATLIQDILEGKLIDVYGG